MTKDGRVKRLDFGLAKLKEGQSDFGLVAELYQPLFYPTGRVVGISETLRFGLSRLDSYYSLPVFASG